MCSNLDLGFFVVYSCPMGVPPARACIMLGLMLLLGILKIAYVTRQSDSTGSWTLYTRSPSSRTISLQPTRVSNYHVLPHYLVTYARPYYCILLSLEITALCRVSRVFLNWQEADGYFWCMCDFCTAKRFWIHKKFL
jgi:ABC-type microcin C transport system permease subunit YejE